MSTPQSTEPPQSIEPVEELKLALKKDNAPGVQQIFQRHPELKAWINEPVGPFDTPAILTARSTDMLAATVEALIAAGTRVPERSGGSEIVRDVLRRSGWLLKPESRFDAYFDLLHERVAESANDAKHVPLVDCIQVLALDGRVVE